ncbi:unnamed protein product [Amoebophrya sp. A25]|nr:unnamed protein product [Amoebophrya sp. A25]|eukprot:GSA25T00025119001.1
MGFRKLTVWDTSFVPAVHGGDAHLIRRKSLQKSRFAVAKLRYRLLPKLFAGKQSWRLSRFLQACHICGDSAICGGMRCGWSWRNHIPSSLWTWGVTFAVVSGFCLSKSKSRSCALIYSPNHSQVFAIK